MIEGYGVIDYNPVVKWRFTGDAKYDTRYLVRGYIEPHGFKTDPVFVVSVGKREKLGKEEAWVLELPVQVNGRFVCTGWQEFPSYD